MVKRVVLFFILTYCKALGQEVIYYPSKEVENGKTQFDSARIKRVQTFGNETEDFLDFKNQTDYRKFSKRQVDATFYGHPKTREEKWSQSFFGQRETFDQVPSLINLLHMLVTKHLNGCAPILLYDKFIENSEELLLQQLLKSFPQAYVHGRISSNNTISESKVLKTLEEQCVNYILFIADVMKSADVLGLQATSKVIVVARSSQWRVQEFLYHKASRNIVNLLIIAQSFREDTTLETPYILYTHNLFIDGLGSSNPEVLTSWVKGKLARPEVNLFPPKMKKGYAGHRFSVIAANQPPFVFKRVTTDNLGNRHTLWEGIEYRILNLLGQKNNFSVEVKEPKDLEDGSGIAVTKAVIDGQGDIGIAGMYVTTERLFTVDMSSSHSQDCAVFISLTSTALPRYRAIMGPFHWTVWVALTFTYLFGIFPLAFSDKHTLRHLIHNSGEIENMFWYMFGTFTNCFTFVGKNSWSKTTKITTRLLIGWYWIFTIIITACYTGSIIAFVTLPVYPATVDTVKQLLSGNYRVGTLDRGGWEKWFANSSDKYTTRLMKHLELVPNIEAGLRNTTRAFFWPYAFLGSKYQLEYVVQSNFTFETAKRAVLHISNECFAPFGVSIAFPKESVYLDKLNKGILTMLESGIISKIESDVKWDMQRTSTGKLLQVSTGEALRMVTIDERGLSLSDTQGMFLLLGAGFLAAGAALISEWAGGCGRMCLRIIKRNRPLSPAASSVSEDTFRSKIVPTPKSKDKSEFADMYDRSRANSGITEDIKKKNDSISQDSDVYFTSDSETDFNTHQVHRKTFKIQVNEYKEPDLESTSKTDVIIHGQSLQLCADVTQVYVRDEPTNGSGHSRESSYVDWDQEINQLFCYTKSELGSDEEQNNEDEREKENSLKKIKDTDIEVVASVFGEKVSPVEVDESGCLVDEEVEPNRDKEEGIILK